MVYLLAFLKIKASREHPVYCICTLRDVNASYTNTLCLIFSNRKRNVLRHLKEAVLTKLS